MTSYYKANRYSASITGMSTIRTEIDQNRFWMYFMRRCVQFLKEKKQYKSVNHICVDFCRLSPYKKLSPDNIKAVMDNNTAYLVSEISMVNFAATMHVDILEVSGLAAKDYMEEQMFKYKVLLPTYIPTTECDPPNPENVIEWVRQKGVAPATRQGKVRMVYYNTKKKKPRGTEKQA